MKNMLPLSLIAGAVVVLLQGVATAQAATSPQASPPAPVVQPIIVAWDRVGTPA
ncbi:MAG TPA: hypothetical protein PL023_12635 [Thiobacillus sp.]|nr:hypothetical protein [Thiobacillus sp.]